MLEEIGLFQAIYSQRAIGEFRPDPVPDELIHKLIESATKAPSGSNRQAWKFWQRAWAEEQCSLIPLRGLQRQT